MTKITFVGDIMCEPLLLKAARKPDGSYQFDGVFRHVKFLLQESDFAVGNLETPLAGEEAGYVRGLFSFNAPDAFAAAVKEAGFSLVTTANNHCVDRGFDGLLRTLDTLDGIGLAHIGTWRSPEERQEAAYFEKDGQRIAVVTSCYGTNYRTNHCLLTPEEEAHISLLHPHTEPVYAPPAKKKSFAKRLITLPLRALAPEHQAWVKKQLHMTYNSPREDSYLDEETAGPYIDRMCADIRTAKEKADFVIFYPHLGGQFNPEPGPFTKYVVEKAIGAGADAVIASHPHIVQRAEQKGSVPCFYSIGNFCMSPNSVYLLHEHLPEYGLAVHLYLDEGQIQKTTFSILKITETRDEMLTVWPVDEMENPDEEAIRAVYLAVTGKELAGPAVRREYC